MWKWNLFNYAARLVRPVCCLVSTEEWNNLQCKQFQLVCFWLCVCVYFRPRSELMEWSWMDAGSEWISLLPNEPILPLQESTWDAPHSECLSTGELEMLYLKLLEQNWHTIICFKWWWWWWWWRRRRWRRRWLITSCLKGLRQGLRQRLW